MQRSPGARFARSGATWRSAAARRLGATLGGLAVAAGLIAASGAVAGPGLAGASSALRCPAGPAAPPADRGFARTGHRWDPAYVVDYTVDVAGVPAGQVGARIADAQRAMRQADALTGLRIHWAGTEAILRNPARQRQLIQFTYTAGTEPLAAHYYYSSTTGRILSGVVDVALAARPGFGGFDAADPVASPEGHGLLYGVGLVMGLRQVPGTWREVMNPDVSARHFATSYEGGDRRGLWRVGAHAGCRGL